MACIPRREKLRIKAPPHSSPQALRASLANRRQNVCNYLGLGLNPDVSLAVEADAHRTGLHVARANDQHGVNLGFLGLLHLAVDLVWPVITLGPDLLGAEFGHDALRVIH